MSTQTLMCFWRHTKLKACFSSHFSRLIKPHNPPWTQGFLQTSLLSELRWKEIKKRFPADIRQSDFKSKHGTQLWLSLSTFLNPFKPKNWESMLVLPTRKQLQTSDKPFCSADFLLFLLHWSWRRGVLHSLSDGQSTVGTSPSPGWFFLASLD